MTETKPRYDWSGLAERGNSYEEIRTALNALKLHCTGLNKLEVYDKNNNF